MEENKEMLQETTQEPVAQEAPTEEAAVEVVAAPEAQAAEQVAPKKSKKGVIGIAIAVVVLLAILVAIFATPESVASNRKKLCSYIEKNGVLSMVYDKDVVTIDADGDALVFKSEIKDGGGGLNYVMSFEMRVRPDDDEVEFNGKHTMELRLTAANYGTINYFGHGVLKISEAKTGVKLYFDEYTEDSDTSHGGKKHSTTSGEAENIAIDGRYWAILSCLDTLLEDAGLTPSDIGFTALNATE